MSTPESSGMPEEFDAQSAMQQELDAAGPDMGFVDDGFSEADPSGLIARTPDCALPLGAIATNPMDGSDEVSGAQDGLSYSDHDLLLYGSHIGAEDIAHIARNAASKEDQDAVQSALKRTLWTKCSTPWNRAYTENNLADLAYTPAELEAIGEARQASASREAAIAKEIAGGTSIWLARVRHNERDVLNPLAVGFYQDDTGKVRTVYGPRYFESKRQVLNTIFQGRTECKEVNLLEGEFVQVEPTEILRSEHWDALPEDLRGHFERGEILLTTERDLYEPTRRDISQVMESGDPRGMVAIVDRKLEDANVGGDGYHLLYYSDDGGESTGRTAVVTTVKDGEVQPVILKVKGKEYVVEVKGCGSKAGGFGDMQFRTGRSIITGGAEAEQATTEFYRLEDDQRDGAPKAVGSILFKNPNHRVPDYGMASNEGSDYEQGYIIRLTPSTVRASYTGSEVYPDIQTPEFVNDIMQLYAAQLVEHLYSDPPKILDRSSHTENILVWGDGQATFTDYCDHVAFADGSFPHYDNHGGDMTPKKMLEFYLAMVDEIPGYSALRDGPKFREFLATSFGMHDEGYDFSDTSDLEELTQKIWEGGMALQVYRGRKDGRYFPSGVVSDFYKAFQSDIATRDMPRTYAAEFVASEKQARLDLMAVIDFYGSEPRGVTLPADFDAESWKRTVETASLTDLIAFSSRVSGVIYNDGNYDVIPQRDRSRLSSMGSYYGAFASIIINPLNAYYEHELDVVTTAQSHCPEDMRDELLAAEAEIRDRQGYLRHLMDTDLAGLFDAVNSPEGLKRILGFSFYGHGNPA